MAESNLAIIVPVYNEETLLQQHLPYFKTLNENFELIFVDGNSQDQTYNYLESRNFTVFRTEQPSRGAQLLLGAKQANQPILLFHHLDSILPKEFSKLIESALSSNTWGRFNISINDKHWMFRVIEFMMNLRSQWTGIATGDQVIFVEKAVFFEFASELNDFPIMEDIYLSKQLKILGSPACIKKPVTTSSRYWRNRGIIKSIILMWQFRLLYFFGVTPSKLYNMYYK